MTGRLHGRCALITGGSRGIGLGVAEAFAREGANIFLVATDAERLRDAQIALGHHQARIETAAADVSDRDACFGVAAQAVAAFGSLEILVNGAATYIARAFLDYTPEEFDRIMQVNLYGAVHMTQAVLPHFLDRGYGKIINIASTAGKWASRNQSAYNITKHGLIGLTRCLALETAEHGVTVNALCPGLVETDLVEQLAHEHAALTKSSPDAVRAALMDRVPIRRLLDVSECGYLAVYLASHESDGMTGQSILLDGGMLMI